MTSRHELDELQSRIAQAVVTLLDRGNRAHVQRRLIANSGLPIETSLLPVIVAVARREPVRIADAAETAGINPSTMSRHAARLERLGAIERRLDPVDGRGTLLALTPSGTEAIDRIYTEMDALFKQLLADWTPEEMRVFGDLLHRFVKQITQAADDQPQGG